MHSKYIEERILEMARYITENNATVRDAANMFSVSKSTVHNDMHTKLYNVNYDLWYSVQEVLAQNKAERHIRGGQATKRKWDLYHCFERKESAAISL